MLDGHQVPVLGPLQHVLHLPNLVINPQPNPDLLRGPVQMLDGPLDGFGVRREVQHPQRFRLRRLHLHVADWGGRSRQCRDLARVILLGLPPAGVVAVTLLGCRPFLLQPPGVDAVASLLLSLDGRL